METRLSSKEATSSTSGCASDRALPPAALTRDAQSGLTWPPRSPANHSQRNTPRSVAVTRALRRGHTWRLPASSGASVTNSSSVVRACLCPPQLADSQQAVSRERTSRSASRASQEVPTPPPPAPTPHQRMHVSPPSPPRAHKKRVGRVVHRRRPPARARSVQWPSALPAHARARLGLLPTIPRSPRARTLPGSRVALVTQGARRLVLVS